MKLYCKGGIVIATHEDWQAVSADLYGEGVSVIDRAQGTAGLDRLGETPEIGAPDLRPFLAPDVGLDIQAAVLAAAVDARAEAERLRWITPGAGQAMTYARKVDEAKAVQAAADPKPDDYPMLAASLGIDGKTIAEIAAVVLAMDASWARVGASIESRRLTLKRDIAAASSAEALAAIDIAVSWPERVG